MVPGARGVMAGAGPVEVARLGGLWRVTRPWHPGLRPYLRSYVGYREAVATPYEARLVPTGRATLLISLAEPFSQVRRLGVRGGEGTERFYETVGFKEVGRVPAAIRVAPDDHRDDITMWLPLV